MAHTLAVHTPSGSWRARLRRFAQLLNRIIGAPDYDTYLAHHARCHPGLAPLSRDDFASERLRDKYSRPGTRCC